MNRSIWVWLLTLVLMGCERRKSQSDPIVSVAGMSYQIPDDLSGLSDLIDQQPDTCQRMDIEGVSFILDNWRFALASSQAQNKPILAVFTGYAMDQFWRKRMLPNESIKSLIQAEYMPLCLMVDDKKLLSDTLLYRPKSKSWTKGEAKLHTVGHLNTLCEVELAHGHNQPLWTVITPDGNVNSILEYTSEADVTLDFLKNGLKK